MLNVIKYLLFLQIMKAGCLFDKENLKLQRLRNFEICTEMCTKETVAIALNANFYIALLNVRIIISSSQTNGPFFQIFF